MQVTLLPTKSGKYYFYEKFSYEPVRQWITWGFDIGFYHENLVLEFKTPKYTRMLFLGRWLK